MKLDSEIVYINDLGADENWHSKIIKYADDTVMIEKINTEFGDKHLLRNWMKINSIDCNYTKTKFVVFEKKSKDYPNIMNEDHDITFCVSYKYLGMHFDKKLNFEIHINNVIAKVVRHSGKLYRSGETLNKRH